MSGPTPLLLMALLAPTPGEPEVWWSLEALEAPSLPPGSGELHPVDAFVGARLAAAGLAPSPEADRRSLLRRVTYDLTGLPPTDGELASFLADERPDAYERVVDRLLASPRFGEQQARRWLDVVHYGDTHGYDKDKRRPHAWRYRDWVVDALNADLPYDHFVELQLAGDVLAPDDPAAVVATGFVVAGPWDFVGHVELREGTIDKQIVRNLDRDDMVATTLSTFASTTAHCARCHDHKFDPVPQRDYYALQAVFAGVERGERELDLEPGVGRRRRLLREELTALEVRLAELAARVAAVQHPELQALDEEVAALEQGLAEGSRLQAEAAPAERSLGYHSAIEAEPDVTKWVQVDLGATRRLDQIVLIAASERFGGHPGPGFGFPPRYRLEVSDDPDFEEGVLLVADRSASDQPNPGDTPVSFEVQASGRFVRLSATRLWERTNDYALALGELVVRSGGEDLARGAVVTSLDSIEAGGSWGRRLLVDGQFARTSEAELRLLAPDSDPLLTLAELAESTNRLASLRLRRPELQLELAAPELRAEKGHALERRSELQAELEALPPPARTYAVTPNALGAPRTIHLLDRGSERSPGEEIGPGALSAVAALSPQIEAGADEGSRRLALARWLTSRKNPLTWRSIANRIWSEHLGRGLVATPNDFGRMGELPTHPELLDWLAVQLRDGDRSLKELRRLIVTSATYRQSSRTRPEAAMVDAGNLLLWRANRRRLSAEELRDTLLFVAGDLREEPRGGPAYDAFAFEDDHSPRYLYEQHDVEDPAAWRRTLYRTVVRSVADPWLETFDCADPNVSVPARVETTTALQALALLNSSFVLSRAEHLAARAGTEDAPVDALVRLTLGREPGPLERKSLLAHAAEHGLASAARVVLNLSELAYLD